VRKFKPKMVAIRDASKLAQVGWGKGRKGRHRVCMHCMGLTMQPPPLHACVQFKEMIKDVKQQPEILVGDEGAVEVARHKDAEAVVTGIVGCAGLMPTVAAIKAGKDICLANKETLIAGKGTVMRAASTLTSLAPDIPHTLHPNPLHQAALSCSPWPPSMASRSCPPTRSTRPSSSACRACLWAVCAASS
jgi:hypothetical protein